MDQQSITLIALVVVLGISGLALGWRDLSAFVRHCWWRHIGLHRLRSIQTVAAPDDKDDDLTFPDHPAVDIEKIINAHRPEPVSKLDEWCIGNWRRLPQWVRTKCVDHLHAVISAAVDGQEALEKWRQQKRDGIRIGSDQYCFHFGTGMFIRNALRQVLDDNDLPGVTYPSGDVYRNWDDAYYGALDELAGRES